MDVTSSNEASIKTVKKFNELKDVFKSENELTGKQVGSSSPLHSSATTQKSHRIKLQSLRREFMFFAAVRPLVLI